MFVTFGAAWPIDRGARVRDIELVERVADEHEVTFVTLVPAIERPAPLDAFARFCARVEAIPLPGSSLGRPLRTAAGLARGVPAAALPSFTPAAFARIGELAREQKVDLVQFEHSLLAPYVGAVPNECRRVLSLHNIGFVQYERMRRTAGNPVEALGYLAKRVAVRRLELSYAPRFDELIAVSHNERAALLEAIPGLPVTVIENGVDTARLRPLPPAASGDRILFVGNLAYRPNVQAVVDFCTKILPVIRSQRRDTSIEIVGPDPPRAVMRLSRPGTVEVTGAVDELEPHYRRATLTVVPLRAGGGTRLKILESMALGRCVVSTAEGCEGLGFTDGQELLVADDDAEFARKTLSLLESKERRLSIAATARRAVERTYDWDAIAARLLDLYGRLVPR
jgi:glycosyltransferase involved in cell wall biosynthesis